MSRFAQKIISIEKGNFVAINLAKHDRISFNSAHNKQAKSRPETGLLPNNRFTFRLLIAKNAFLQVKSLRDRTKSCLSNGFIRCSQSSASHLIIPPLASHSTHFHHVAGLHSSSAITDCRSSPAKLKQSLNDWEYHDADGRG